MTKKQSLLRFMDRVPPALIRIMAIKRMGRGNLHELMSLDEISKASGLPRRSVQRLASRKTWADVKLSVASKFIEGCGANVLSNTDTYRFVQHHGDKNFNHLNNLQRRRFFALMGWSEDGK